MSELPIIVVSSCLLGHPVRYDGAEKGVAWISEELPQRAVIRPACPEVGAGMPVPRPPIQIVRDGGVNRVQVVGVGQDLTDSVVSFMQDEIAQLKRDGIDGAILKARSPSCGIRDTPHYSTFERGATPLAVGAGLWADALMKHFPKIPVADESDLLSEAGQEEFLKRVRVHWQARCGTIEDRS
ncbi:MAG: DUF523 domain-containing protein [Kofleriaceae bacterium]|nr:DUF523 domain-containing protein [Kofleriaceae bacterium]